MLHAAGLEGLPVERLVAARIEAEDEVVQRQESALTIPLGLLVHRHLDEEDVAGLQVLGQGIHGNDLAGPDHHRPVPGHALQLAIAHGPRAARRQHQRHQQPDDPMHPSLPSRAASGRPAVHTLAHGAVPVHVADRRRGVDSYHVFEAIEARVGDLRHRIASAAPSSTRDVIARAVVDK
jgi:hypothetical protein